MLCGTELGFIIPITVNDLINAPLWAAKIVLDAIF